MIFYSYFEKIKMNQNLTDNELNRLRNFVINCFNNNEMRQSLCNLFEDEKSFNNFDNKIIEIMKKTEEKFRYENNIDKIIVLQRFARRNFKYFVFKRWIKSKEFNEWFYHPDNIGGKNAKRRLRIFLENTKK